MESSASFFLSKKLTMKMIPSTIAAIKSINPHPCSPQSIRTILVERQRQIVKCATRQKKWASNSQETAWWSRSSNSLCPVTASLTPSEPRNARSDLWSKESHSGVNSTMESNLGMERLSDTLLKTLPNSSAFQKSLLMTIFYSYASVACMALTSSSTSATI